MYIDSYINLYIQLAWIDTYGCMYVIYVGKLHLAAHFCVCVCACVREANSCMSSRCHMWATFAHLCRRQLHIQMDDSVILVHFCCCCG